MSDSTEHYIIHIHTVPRWSWLPRWTMRFCWLRRQFFVVRVDPEKRENLVSISPSVRKGDAILFTYETQFEDYSDS